jgi:predicted DsbA family dithiol-disulfide isomerase
MFRAHFGQARKLWTTAEVLGFAAEIGLDQQEAAAALHDHRYRDQVNADQREAQRLGAHGTPRSSSSTAVTPSPAPSAPTTCSPR